VVASARRSISPGLRYGLRQSLSTSGYSKRNIQIPASTETRPIRLFRASRPIFSCCSSELEILKPHREQRSRPIRPTLHLGQSFIGCLLLSKANFPLTVVPLTAPVATSSSLVNWSDRPSLQAGIYERPIHTLSGFGRNEITK
jgi:hypothetical protein